MTDSPVRVPQLRRVVEGKSYGGQYWERAEYEVTAAVGDDGRVEIALLDTSDRLLTSLHLPAASARALLDELNAVDQPDLVVPDVPGLRRTVVWRLGTSTDVVDLGPALDEIAAWLEYATGRSEWDGEYDSWEY